MSQREFRGTLLSKESLESETLGFSIGYGTNAEGQNLFAAWDVLSTRRVELDDDHRQEEKEIATMWRKNSLL